METTSSSLTAVAVESDETRQSPVSHQLDNLNDNGTSALPPDEGTTRSRNRSVQDILTSAENSELKFGLLIGLVKVGDVSSNEVVDSVLHLLVSGTFDMDSNFIIQNSSNIIHMLKLISASQPSLQAEIWSMFTAILKKSRRNLQACTEVGLVSFILDLIPDADPIVADLLIDVLGVLATYSITVKDLKTLFGFMKVVDGKWKQHSVKLLSVLRQMPQKDGPAEFFSFPGNKGSYVSLPPIKTWPYPNGWTFSCWLRLDPSTGANQDREKPYLYCFRTSKGLGYSAHFIGSSLIVTAMKVKGKGFQHCVKFEFQPRKWYMVSLVHVYNRWSKSELRCYIDGQLVSFTDMSWPVSTSDVFDKCVIGTNGEADQDGTFCGQMSTLYLFSDALTQPQVAAIYQLGPAYKSQFRFDSESGPHINEQYKKILFDGRLTSAIVFMYNPIACDGQLCLESSPKTNASFFVHTPHAMMAGDVKAVITHSIHSALHSLGGIEILYPLFGQLDLPVSTGTDVPSKRDYTICSTLIYLLHDLLESSATIQQQMFQTKGFLVISYLLEKSSREHLTPLVLDAFLKITQYLVVSGNNPNLLRNIFDRILFNPGLWIHSDIEVQTKLYCYLATDFIESQIYTNVRRVSSVLQTMHSLKYYYWVVNPQDRSGITPKGVDGPRPTRDEILKLRSFMLLYTRQLILKGNGILEDELQSMLNYLTTLHEDDNLMDVVEMLTCLMAEHPATLIPAFDTKLGVRTVFKLLASRNEALRLQSLKLLGFFLQRSTYKRKEDSLMKHNQFSLLGERLMLNCTEITMATYNTLFELLTEKMTLDPCPDTMHPEPESTYRLENSAILKVMATMIKQSQQTAAVMDVKRLFLSDLTILCHNNRDNRRTVLQMSVWQDWLFSLAYVYPPNQDEQRITDAVMTLFRMLLHHAIKYEFGGWRVWIDTLAILHSKVSYMDFKIHMSDMYLQYEQNRVDHVTDPDQRRNHPVSTISGVSEQVNQTAPIKNNTLTIKEIKKNEDANEEKTLETVDEEEDSGMKQDGENDEGLEINDSSQIQQTGHAENPSECDLSVKEEDGKASQGNSNVEQFNESMQNTKQTDADINLESPLPDGKPKHQIYQSDSHESESDAAKKTSPSTGDQDKSEDTGTSSDQESSPAEKVQMHADSSQDQGECSQAQIDSLESHADSSELHDCSIQNQADSSQHQTDASKSEASQNQSIKPKRHSSGPNQTTTHFTFDKRKHRSGEENKSAPSPSRRGVGPAGDSNMMTSPTKSTRKIIGVTKPDDDNDRFLFSPTFRAAPFRIPEFRWSYLHQKLLSDLLFSIETDLQAWKSHNAKSVIDFVNASNNHVYVVNVTHMISQLADNLITSCGGLLPLLAAATSPNGEVEILEPTQGLSIEQAVLILQRIMNMTDVLVFASSTNFSELEQEKNMPSGGIMRQCLRLVCTAAVRNCLECRHRRESQSGETSPVPAHSYSEQSGLSKTHDPIKSLIHGSAPSAKNIVENLGGQMSLIADAEKLLQDMDINRLRAVVYRDVDAKHAQFIALAIVYFCSVLMVSKYRDILEPPTPSATPSATPTSNPSRSAKVQPPLTKESPVSTLSDHLAAQISATYGSMKTNSDDPDLGDSVLSHMASVANSSNDPPKDEEEEDAKVDEVEEVEEAKVVTNRATGHDSSMDEEEGKVVETVAHVHITSDEAVSESADEKCSMHVSKGNIATENDDDQSDSAKLKTDDIDEGVKKEHVAVNEEASVDDEISDEDLEEDGGETSESDEAKQRVDKENAEGGEDVEEGVVDKDERESDTSDNNVEEVDNVQLEAESSEVRVNGGGIQDTEAGGGIEENSDLGDNIERVGEPDKVSSDASPAADDKMDEISLDDHISEPQDSRVLVLTNGEIGETDTDPVNATSQIAAISVIEKHQHKPSSLDLSASIPAPVGYLPMINEGGSLTERLERALGPVAPLLREVFVDFAPFLSKTLIGSHGQELLIGGLVTLRQSTSVVELVMLLCSQEWQNSLQKHAGLAFIELVNEGRLLAHATRDHIVRVANEAEFILNRMRAEDVQKHAEFESLSAETLLVRKEEEKLCDHLITSAKRRDHTIAARHRDKIINLLANKHGPWAEYDSKETFWRLDFWEDDSRRHRRLVKNPHGSSHPEATLKAALEHGATEDAINQARDAVHAHLLATKRSQQQTTEYTDEELLMDDRELDVEPVGPVAMSTRCHLIAPGVAVIGTMSITKTELYFEMDDESAENQAIDPKVLGYVDHIHGKWHFSEIRAIFSRRYLLQNVALEIFMSNRSAVMFAFSDHETVKKVVNALPRVGVGIKYGITQSRRMSQASGKQIFHLSNMMQKWQRREISNFDYLMYLNTVAGRTYNDLNQYPVFPWVIVNYDCDDLDLSQPSNYRDMSKPVGALNPTRREFFEDRYSSWDHDQIPPFHYGTHYSTAAFTLNWLIRVEPFTTIFLNLQGGKFDHANRTFASLSQAWKNCQRDTSDVKELIPEFFYLSEMLTNRNGFKFGTNENNQLVDEVELPKWANSPEDVVRVNRMALESEFVSCQLHHWIDLIFGYKQRGPEAVRATNVFYYLTYEGSVNLESMTDHVMKAAIENQIRSFGQTPTQLLTEPHPPRSSVMHLLTQQSRERRSILYKSPMMFSSNQEDICMIMKFLSNSPVTHVAANTHPAVPNPAVITITANHNFAINKWNQNYQPHSTSTSFSSDKQETQPSLPLSMDQLLVVNTGLHRRSLGDNFDERLKVSHTSFVTSPDNRFIFACGFWDNSFRVFATDNGRVIQVVFGHYDVVTCIARSECNIAQDCYVVTGSKDCTVMLWLWSSRLLAVIGENGHADQPTSKVTLTGHQTEVTCVSVLAELGVVLSGSSGGPCLMHTLSGDLLRALEPPKNCVTPQLICLSREAFAIVKYDQGHIAVYSINGRLLCHVEHNDTINVIILTRDGQYMLTGGDNGMAEVWRVHDLTLLYSYPACDSQIRSIVLSHDYKLLMAGLTTGCLLVFNIDLNKWHHEYQAPYT